MDTTMSDADLAASQGIPPITQEEERSGRARWTSELQQRPEFYIAASLSTVSPDASPTDAVQRLVELTRACGPAEVGDHCWYTACCLLEVIAHTAPEAQARLVGFVHCLRATSVVREETGQLVEHGGRVVWRDLPTFGYTIADELGSFNGLEDEYGADEVERYENLMAFFAQLDASTEDPELDFSNTTALTALDWAFNNPSPTGPTEVSVRLACLWFIFDADKMWRKAMSAQVEGYSRENWDEWKEELVGAKLGNYDVRTNALIDNALAHIERVESG